MTAHVKTLSISKTVFSEIVGKSIGEKVAETNIQKFDIQYERRERMSRALLEKHWTSCGARHVLLCCRMSESLLCERLTATEENPR